MTDTASKPRPRDVPSERQVRRAAEVAVQASLITGNILPRDVYTIAGAPIPANATEEYQRKAR